MLGGEGRGVHHHVQDKPQEAVEEDGQAKATEKGVHDRPTEQLHLLVGLDRHVVGTEDSRKKELLHTPLGEVLADRVDEGDSGLEAGLWEVEEGH